MRRLFSVLVACLLFAGVASAEPLTWNSNYSGAFFNNVSWDSRPTTACNVGGYLTGGAGCTAAGFTFGSPNVALPYFGDGQDALLFGGAWSAEFLTGVSAHVDEFGWYDTGTGRQYSLFTNGAPAGTSASWSNGSFGFYFRDTNKNETWLSGVPGSDVQSHFALFNAGNGTYYLGMEDLRGPLPNATDFDYNDAIVKLTAQPVPEPGSMALMGTGLLFLAGRIRKWGR